MNLATAGLEITMPIVRIMKCSGCNGKIIPRCFRSFFPLLKEMIALRKQNPIIHMKKELKVMDSLGCGYPDISYHGAEAWRPDLSFVSRLVSIFLCGRYANEGDPFLYLAYNMHWEAHKLALPKLPKTLRWKRILSTEEEAGGEGVEGNGS